MEILTLKRLHKFMSQCSQQYDIDYA